MKHVVLLEDRINSLSDLAEPARSPENLGLLRDFREALNRGDIRAAEPCANGWKVNLWVKKGLLLHLRMGVLRELSADNRTAAAGAAADGDGAGFELDTFPRRRFAMEDGVRLLPGGAYIRDGAYLASGVTCMPPVFVNIGAHIGEGSVLDSHSMVGLCAQIGEDVHIGPGSQIGGTIIPFEALPVVIGDEASVGGCCGIFGSVMIGRGAIIAPGTVLAAQSPVYDAVQKDFLRADETGLLTIPPGAVIAPGACPFSTDSAEPSPMMLLAAIITSYRPIGNSFPAGFKPNSPNGPAESH